MSASKNNARTGGRKAGTIDRTGQVWMYDARGAIYLMIASTNDMLCHDITIHTAVALEHLEEGQHTFSERDRQPWDESNLYWGRVS